MIRQLTLLLILITVFGHALPAGAQDKQLDRLCMDILQDLQSFYPVRSTEMGIHEYDHRFTNYSSSSVRDMIKKLTDYEQKLYKYRGANLSTDDRIKFQLIKSNTDIALHDLKRLEWHEKLPVLYVDEAVDGIYLLLISHHAPMDQKVVTIIERIKAVPALFATAKEQIDRPPQLWADEALTSIESANDFYQSVAGELMRQFPDRADDILKYSTAAREAMTDFATWLAGVKTGDPGDFAIGKDAFDYKLKHQYFLDYDSDSLLALGETLLAEAQQEYADYLDYMQASHQTGNEEVFMPSCFSRDDIIAYYNWEVDRVRKFLEDNDVVTIPEDIAPIEVIQTPPFLRSKLTGIAYHPAGPFDQVQQAYFYVRPIPEDLDSVQLAARYRYVHRRGFKGSVVHEAYPGHHLQMQIAGMHPDPVRKWQQNFMAIEGWALYCEEMMYEAGLYGEEDPAMWRAILGGIRFRAARIVADVKLHTGQFTYQECVDWMIEALETDTDSGKDYIRNQVRLYTHQPTYRMAYLTGKLEILKMRDAMAERDGDDFMLRDFHDDLLAEGSIPPALAREALGL